MTVSANASTNVYFTSSDNIPYSSNVAIGDTFSSNLVAGDIYDIYAGVGDEFGNLKKQPLSSANAITVVTSLLNSSPSGNAPTGNVYISDVVLSGNYTANIQIIPTDYQTDAVLSLTLNGSDNTVNEFTSPFTVTYNNAQFVDFVDSTGVYSSGNSFADGVFSEILLVMLIFIESVFLTLTTTLFLIMIKMR